MGVNAYSKQRGGFSKNNPLKTVEPAIMAILIKIYYYKIYTLGSRVCGQFHHESNLDVTIEIDHRKGDTNSFSAHS